MLRYIDCQAHQSAMVDAATCIFCSRAMSGRKYDYVYELQHSSIFHTAADRSLAEKVYQFVKSLLGEIEVMDRDTKQLLYPNLVVGLANQRSVLLGRFSHRVHDAMIELELEMKDSPNTIDKMTFPTMTFWHEPSKWEVFPRGPASHLQYVSYTDTERMCITLQALVDLKTAKQNSNQPKKMVPGPQSH